MLLQLIRNTGMAAGIGQRMRAWNDVMNCLIALLGDGYAWALRPLWQACPPFSRARQAVRQHRQSRFRTFRISTNRSKEPAVRLEFYKQYQSQRLYARRHVGPAHGAGQIRHFPSRLQETSEVLGNVTGGAKQGVGL